MDMQAEKLALIQWLAQLTDENIKVKVKALRNGQSDWWDAISAEEKAEIEDGLIQADNGEVKPHSEILKKYEKWLLK